MTESWAGVGSFEGLGVLLWSISPACSFAPTNAHVAPRLVLWTLLVTTAMTVLFPTQGKIRLWVLVRISTVLGTVAVLVGSIVAVAVVRNFAGVVIGTGCVLADFSWSASDDI